MSDRARRVRAVARWILPYGIQRQLRDAQSRRKERQRAEEVRMTVEILEPSEREPSRVG